jgi:hypothetical protein
MVSDLVALAVTLAILFGSSLLGRCRQYRRLFVRRELSHAHAAADQVLLQQFEAGQSF